MKRNRTCRLIPLFLVMFLAFCFSIPAFAAEELVITRQPQNYTYPENSVATWTVEAHGENLSYHWYLVYNGKTYDTKKSFEENMAWASGAGEGYGTDEAGTSFFINGIQSSLSGAELYCEISNGTSSVKSTPVLISVGGIAMPPEMVVPSSMTVEIGTNVDLYVGASDYNGGTLSYLWYETGSGKLQDIIAVNRGEETTSSLHCDTATAGTRYYVCAVTTSGGGSAYTNVIPVTVTEKQAATSTAPDESSTPNTQTPNASAGTDAAASGTDSSGTEQTNPTANGFPWWIVAVGGIAVLGGGTVAVILIKKKKQR